MSHAASVGLALLLALGRLTAQEPNANDSIAHRLQQNVALMPPYPGRTPEKISVQSAVKELLRQVGVGYDRSRSYSHTRPVCLVYIRPKIRDVACRKALESILKPKGLDFVVVGGRVVLVRKGQQRGRFTPALPLVEPVPIESEPTKDYNRIRQETETLMNAGEFEKLNALARKLRQSKEMYPDGRWRLDYFYLAVFTPFGGTAEENWQALLERLNQWRVATPESVVPHIALAEALVSYAWKARGTGWANTVTKENLRLMDERLTKARTVLFPAKALKEKCPAWWACALDIALGQGWDMRLYNRTFEEGLAFEPTYYMLYFCKAYHLLPRWYGEEGEWEEFAAASADRIGGEEGDILYARIAWNINSHVGNIAKIAALSWPRVMRGFDALLKRYPNSYRTLNEYCLMCWMTIDRPRIRTLMDKIGPNVDLHAWRHKKMFLRAREFAYSARPVQLPTHQFRDYKEGARKALGDLYLEALNTEPDGERRWIAIEVLGSLRDRRAVPRLIGFVNQKGSVAGYRQCWLAARALGRIGEPAAAPALIDALSSLNRSTRNYALKGLQTITGQKLKTQEEWREWWAANQPAP